MSHTIVHDPENVKPYDKIWVWLSRDKDGNEGIVSTGVFDQSSLTTTFRPLVTGDPALVPIIQKEADRVAKATNSKTIVRAEYMRITG